MHGTEMELASKRCHNEIGAPQVESVGLSIDIYMHTHASTRQFTIVYAICILHLQRENENSIGAFGLGGVYVFAILPFFFRGKTFIFLFYTAQMCNPFNSLCLHFV